MLIRLELFGLYLQAQLDLGPLAADEAEPDDTPATIADMQHPIREWGTVGFVPPVDYEYGGFIQPTAADTNESCP